MSDIYPQVYRASVAGMILNNSKQILMVQNTSFKENEWDFPKGGMIEDEEEIDTLKREIREELGNDLKYSIIKQSSINIIYSWSKDKQRKEGMRGQARISFWLSYLSGVIELDPNEIRQYKWVELEELEDLLKKSRWPSEVVQNLMFDLDRVNKIRDNA